MLARHKVRLLLIPRVLNFNLCESLKKKKKAFVATLKGKVQIFYLPPYSPDRNPDELV